jgi:hypothetical protein
MFVLYTDNPGGSMEIERLQRVSDDRFGVTKRQAIQLMRARNCSDGSIEHLEETPYELWDSRNGFGDKFKVLWWDASLEEYTEMEHLMENGNYLRDEALPEICEAFKTVGVPLRFIAMDLNMDDGVQAVPAPRVRTTSEVVEAALGDSETLIHTSGAPNALDRVHTAFHAYLREICEDADITVPTDADITALFARMRDTHPHLKIADSVADKMMVEIQRGFARVIDALNPVRNSKSLAHPNALLDPPEAMLAINAIRTMLHYLDSRLKGA